VIIYALLIMLVSVPVGFIDVDGDGVNDIFADANGDGINDVNGTPYPHNFPFVDSTADGINDVFVDANGDGVNDYIYSRDDVEFMVLDCDSDGLNDITGEEISHSISLPFVDEDGDGISDYYQKGLREFRGIRKKIFIDVDQDGIMDGRAIDAVRIVEEALRRIPERRPE